MNVYIYMNMLSGKMALAATAVSQLKACLNLLIMQQVPDPKICCNSRLTKRVWLVCTALSPSSGEWNNYLATFCNCSALTVIFLNPTDILILVAIQSFFFFFKPQYNLCFFACVCQSLEILCKFGFQSCFCNVIQIALMCFNHNRCFWGKELLVSILMIHRKYNKQSRCF